MMSNGRSGVRRSLATALILFACMSPAAVKPMAQQKYWETYSGSVFRCLQKKWQEIQYDKTSGYAFIPETSQNLAWDKDKRAWIDTKTLQPVWGDCKNLRGALFVGCIQDRWPDAHYDKTSSYGYVPETGHNFAWDKEKQAWIDVKTLECICPSKCETPKAEPKPQPKPSPSTTTAAGTTKGAVDSCLVGTWRSESLYYQGAKEPGGGLGIVMTIEPFRKRTATNSESRVTVDYGQMQAVEYKEDCAGGCQIKELWKGICAGTLRYESDEHKFYLSPDERKCKVDYEGTRTDSGYVTPRNSVWTGFGPVGITFTTGTTQCNETTLTGNQGKPSGGSLTIVFKREKKAP